MIYIRFKLSYFILLSVILRQCKSFDLKDSGDNNFRDNVVYCHTLLMCSGCVLFHEIVSYDAFQEK